MINWQWKAHFVEVQDGCVHALLLCDGCANVWKEEGLKWRRRGEERFLVLHLQIISSGWTISNVMYELNLGIHNLFRDPTDHEADP